MYDRVPLNDIRVNGPKDGWLTDPQNNLGTFGDVGPGGDHSAAQVPGNSFWLGNDSWGTNGWYRSPWEMGGPGLGEVDVRGMVVPAITRCSQVIVNAITRTEWVCETHAGQDPVKEPLPLWILDPMLLGSVPGDLQPNAPVAHRLSGHDFWSTVTMHALLWGKGVFAFLEAADGTPLPGTLRILNPFLVSQHGGSWRVDSGRGDDIVTDFDGRFTLGAKTWRLAVMRGFSPHDGAMPEGVLTRHWEAFRIQAEVSSYIADSFGSEVPTGILKARDPDMTQAEAQDLLDSFRNAHGGSGRSTALLNATVDFQPIALKPLDADIEKVSQATLRDVALAFNLDPIWVGLGSSGMSYNNQSDRNKSLVDISVSPMGQSLMDLLSSLLPYQHRLRVSWVTFVSPTIEQQLPTLVQASGGPVLTQNEAREFAGLGPIIVSDGVDPAPDSPPDEEGS